MTGTTMSEVPLSVVAAFATVTAPDPAGLDQLIDAIANLEVPLRHDLALCCLLELRDARLEIHELTSEVIRQQREIAALRRLKPMITMTDHGVAVAGQPPHILKTRDQELIVEYLNRVVRPDVLRLHDEDSVEPLDRCIELLRSGDVAAADYAVSEFDVELKEVHGG